MSGKTYYGGQAVMEGVMMRGRSTMAVAVRAPNGEIAVYHEALSGSDVVRRVRPCRSFAASSCSGTRWFLACARWSSLPMSSLTEETDDAN